MERWETLAEIEEARERIAAGLTGWTQPAAYAIGLVPSGAVAAAEHFPVANTTEHKLPAVVASSVLGYRSGSVVLELSRESLARIVAELEPAEAYTEIAHPNLWTWRDFLPVLDADPGARVIAVFLATRDAPLPGPEADALRAALGDAAA